MSAWIQSHHLVATPLFVGVSAVVSIRMLRRRLALGLADPLVANRFLVGRSALPFFPPATYRRWIGVASQPAA